MARYGKYTPQTRMEKTAVLHGGTLAPGATSEIQFQLEGGDEECQVKRLILSAGGDHIWSYSLYLSDEAMTGAQPIDRLVAQFGGLSGQIIDRTTTMRVPRGFHLLAILTNVDGNQGTFVHNSVLHYKVLS